MNSKSACAKFINSPRAVAPAPVNRLLDIHPFVPVQEQSHHRGRSKEDAVHDGESEARLEHGARLVRADAPWRVIDGERTQGDAIRTGGDAALGADASADADAVGRCDAAQLVCACDEGTHEAQVDKSHEQGAAPRALAANEGNERPSRGQHADDEEYQYVGGRQLVSLVVAVDKVGKHAQRGD